MTKQLFKIVGVVATVVVIILGGILIRSARVQAKDKDVDNDESRIQQGFDIAPVPVNVARKNRALVGLGSYLVNGPGDCNICHNAGPGNNQFLPGGNPFFGQPKHINPSTLRAIYEYLRAIPCIEGPPAPDPLHHDCH